MIGGNV